MINHLIDQKFQLKVDDFLESIAYIEFMQIFEHIELIETLAMSGLMFNFWRGLMKTLLKGFTLLLGLMACFSAYLVLPASADSTASLILSLKCQGGYNINVWKRYNSGEILYRSTSPQGNLSLGKGTSDNTGAAQVYKFKNGNYEYQVLGGRGDHQGQGTLEVYKNGRSIMSQSCTANG